MLMNEMLDRIEKVGGKETRAMVSIGASWIALLNLFESANMDEKQKAILSKALRENVDATLALFCAVGGMDSESYIKITADLIAACRFDAMAATPPGTKH